MTEQLISFETAKLAMTKGYRLTTQLGNEVQLYNDSGRLIENIDYEPEFDITEESHDIIAPTQSFLQKWLREKHGQHILIIPTVTSAWTYKTVKVTSEIDNDVILGLKSVNELPPYKGVSGEDFNTYEEALEAALFEALKLLP